MSEKLMDAGTPLQLGRIGNIRASIASGLRRPVAMSGFGVVVGLVVWEIIGLLLHDKILLPTPIETITTWIYYMHTPYPTLGIPLWMHAAESMARILVGFCAGTLIGLIIGAGMAAIKPVRSFMDPFIEATRPLPPLAFIPVLVVWFGIGDLPKVVLIMVGVVPIITVSTVAALDRIPVEMINASRCLGASPLYTLLHVQIRGALPHLITGMRLAMGVSWTSIVAAEMIVATSGVGYVILQASLYLDTSLIFAGIFSIALLGIGFDVMFRLVQRAFDPSGSA